MCSFSKKSAQDNPYAKEACFGWHILPSSQTYDKDAKISAVTSGLLSCDFGQPHLLTPEDCDDHHLIHRRIKKYVAYYFVNGCLSQRKIIISYIYWACTMHQALYVPWHLISSKPHNDFVAKKKKAQPKVENDAL